MKNKQLKKSIKSKMIPITKRLNTESELYLYNETLIKLYNSKVNLEDKKRILDKLSTFDIKECLTPTFALYEGSTLSGIQMDYLYDYDAIYDILNNSNLDFNTRKMIAFKICQIILEIESKNAIYHDIHEDNILIKGNDIKVIDMDNILLPNELDKYEYEIDRLQSRRRLIYLCMQLLLNKVDFNISDLHDSRARSIYTLSSPKQKEFYSFTFLGTDNKINPADYLDYFNEDYIEAIKKISY